MGKRLAAMLSGLCVSGAFVFVTPPAVAAPAVDNASGTALLSDINAKRTTMTRPRGALVSQAKMTSLAEQHSMAMANRHLLSHFGFSKRVAQIYADDSGIKNNYICENVAYVRNAALNSATAADALFTAWMHSRPHKRCMLDIRHPSTQSAGIGVVQDGNTWWATFIGAHDTSP